MRVGQWAKTVVIFLSSSIPESQANRSAIYHDTSGVVIKSAGIRSTHEVRIRRGVSGSKGGTDTVGIYSPGKALVVYEIRRHVYRSISNSDNEIDRSRKREGGGRGREREVELAERGATYFSYRTITRHHTLCAPALR